MFLKSDKSKQVVLVQLRSAHFITGHRFTEYSDVNSPRVAFTSCQNQFTNQYWRDKLHDT